MQSTKVHLDRLDPEVIDWVVKELRDRARREVRYGSRNIAAELRAINEFLLRPTAAIVRQIQTATKGPTNDV